MADRGEVEFERRAFPRFRMELPMLYELQPEGTVQAGRTLNGSQGGLAVHLPQPVVPGAHLRVRLHLSDPKAPRLLEIVGRVVWVAETAEGAARYKVGLVFENVTPETVTLLRRFERVWLERSL